jgi:hypothetical protein
VIHGEIPESLVLRADLRWHTNPVLRTGQDTCALDNAFALIEGHPSHSHPAFQPGIEGAGFAILVFQSALVQLARLLLQHRNLLVARMQITAYDLHVLGSFPPSLGF